MSLGSISTLATKRSGWSASARVTVGPDADEALVDPVLVHLPEGDGDGVGVGLLVVRDLLEHVLGRELHLGRPASLRFAFMKS